MKKAIFILALCFSTTVFADSFTNAVCEVVASNYARGSAWDKGQEGVLIDEAKTTQLKDSTLVVVVKTSYVEDYLIKTGSSYSYYCYRCGEADIRVSVESKMALACK